MGLSGLRGRNSGGLNSSHVTSPPLGLHLWRPDVGPDLSQILVQISATLCGVNIPQLVNYRSIHY